MYLDDPTIVSIEEYPSYPVSFIFIHLPPSLITIVDWMSCNLCLLRHFVRVLFSVSAGFCQHENASTNCLQISVSNQLWPWEDECFQLDPKLFNGVGCLSFKHCMTQ